MTLLIIFLYKGRRTVFTFSLLNVRNENNNFVRLRITFKYLLRLSIYILMGTYGLLYKYEAAEQINTGKPRSRRVGLTKNFPPKRQSRQAQFVEGQLPRWETAAGDVWSICTIRVWIARVACCVCTSVWSSGPRLVGANIRTPIVPFLQMRWRDTQWRESRQLSPRTIDSHSADWWSSEGGDGGREGIRII